MKKLLKILCFFIMINLAIGCTPGPQKLTEHFLTDLREERYTDAEGMASTQLKQQIEVIIQDKNALYNGQKWDYHDLTTELKGKNALVFYTVKLNDGSDIKQKAILAKSKDTWLIESIENIKINYSWRALKDRTYPDNGNRMLIAPLDIETISESKLAKHIGQFVMVSGNLCDFDEQNNKLIMAMGEDSSRPLLYITVTDSAKVRAVKEHKQFMQTDYMLESPLGSTFTAIGLLRGTKGRYSMEISDPQHVIIGEVLRVEK